jgi:hypothetical protein
MPRLALGTALAALALLAAGCSGVGGFGGQASKPPRPLQICNAKAAQSFVGRSNTAATLEAARRKSGSYVARVLGENQPATTEYNQERLNLIVNSSGQITAARCG